MVHVFFFFHMELFLLFLSLFNSGREFQHLVSQTLSRNMSMKLCIFIFNKRLAFPLFLGYIDTRKLWMLSFLDKRCLILPHKTSTRTVTNGAWAATCRGHRAADTQNTRAGRGAVIVSVLICSVVFSVSLHTNEDTLKIKSTTLEGASFMERQSWKKYEEVLTHEKSSLFVAQQWYCTKDSHCSFCRRGKRKTLSEL